MPRSLTLLAAFTALTVQAQLERGCMKMNSSFFINQALGGFVQTTDGGYASVGTFSESNDGYSDIGITKFDANGNMLWMHKLSAGNTIGAYAYAAIPTADGGLAIAGPHYNQGGFFLAKLDVAGNVEWAKVYTSDTFTLLPSWYYDGFVQTNDGGFAYFCSQVTISHGYCMLRTDANGDVLWSDEIRYTDFATDMAELPNGDLVFTGWASSGNLASLTVRKDGLTGATEWMHWYKGSIEEFSAFGITVGADSTILLTGYSAVWAAGERMHLTAMALSAGGDPLWMTQVRTVDHTVAYEVAVHPDGGYVIVGNAQEYGTYDQIAASVTKLAGDGQLEWSKRYVHPDLSWNWFTRVNIADDGDILVSGYDTDDLDYPQVLYKLGPDGSSCPYCTGQDTGHYVALTPVIAPVGGFMDADPWAVAAPLTLTLTDYTAQVQADLCGTVGLEETPAKVSVSVAPNPCAERCTITLPASVAQHATTIELRDALGRIVHQQRVTGGATTLDVSDLAATSYIYRVTDGMGTIATGKIQVMRPY